MAYMFKAQENIYMYVSEQYAVTLDMIHIYIETMSIQNEFGYQLKSNFS